MWNNKKAYVPLIDNHLTSSLYRFDQKNSCLPHFSLSLFPSLSSDRCVCFMKIMIYHFYWECEILVDRFTSETIASRLTMEYLLTTESMWNNGRKKPNTFENWASGFQSDNAKKSFCSLQNEKTEKNIPH